MTRLIAAFAVIVVAFAFAGAQPAAKDNGPLTARLDEKNQWVWTLSADGEISIGDMLSLYSSCRNVLILVDERKVTGQVSFKVPENTELTGDDIDLFVANSIEEFRLILTRAGGNQYKVIPSAEAVTSSAVVTVDELEATPSWQWTTLVYHPQNVEENALRGALQNLATRQGGCINPVQGGGLLISDRADRVRSLYKAASEIDESMASETKSYDLPAGVKIADAVRALQELLGMSQRFRMNPPTFTRATSETAVLVRGTADLHADVAEALKVMK